MYTRPEWRARGLATALLQEIILCAKDEGLKTIRLNASDMGRPVYEKAGFISNTAAMQFGVVT